ncbi:MAG: DMT family transporter [Alphaproteobacteria bacterium]|nr:DMT family transporter [Alphaproteobacteria bacterium]
MPQRNHLMSQQDKKFQGLGTRPFLGVMLALISALFLGLTPTLAKVAYNEGAGLFTVILVRSGLVPVLTLFCYSIIIKQPLRLHKIPRKAVMIAGLSLSLTAFGLMSAINFISPGLAVTILYAFPIIVLISVAFMNRQLPSLKLILIYLIAFLGLAVAIGAKFDTVSWLGVGLAFCAAIGASMLMFLGHMAGSEVKSHSILFVGSSAVGLLALLMMLLTGNVALPASSLGWGVLILAALCYTCGMVMVIVSTTVLRPDLATLFMNIEPFVSIGAAYLLLGDILTPIQFIGVIAVIFAISVGGIVAHREHLEPEDMTIIEHS